MRKIDFPTGTSCLKYIQALALFAINVNGDGLKITN